MNTEVWLLPAALLAFGAVAWFSQWYGRDWQPPAGSEGSNWTLRRNIGLGLGALAVLVAAVASLLFVRDGLARWFIVGQAVLLAASGFSDVRRFHLPLPITLAGTGLAIATAVTLRTPPLIVIFGLIWALVLIVLYTLATRRAMALGDYIAAVWIALAAPFNGLIAVIAGDIANFVFVRVTGLHTNRKAKLAAAGPWLLFAAALIALPPFVTWSSRFKASAAVMEQAPITASAPAAALSAASSATELSVAAPPTAQDLSKAAARVRMMLWLARNASDATAKVAFEQNQAGRMAKAKSVAAELDEYVHLAEQFDTDVAFTSILRDLRLALSLYDVDAVRETSDRLAEAQTRLSLQLAALSPTPTPSAEATTDSITTTLEGLPDQPTNTVDPSDASDPYKNSSDPSEPSTTNTQN